MADQPLHSLMQIYAELGRQVAAESTTGGALQAVTTVAVRSVPGADTASITRQRVGSYETVAATGEAARRADAIQYELGNGPCIDAVVKDHVFHAEDLATDPRWPIFGPLAVDATGLRSVLSIRLALDEDLLMAGLNLYACRPSAFQQDARELAMLLATHAGVVITKLAAQEKAAQLQDALASSREIGLAMGVLMAAHKVTREQAFDMLRIASQHRHRKLREIAVEVADTGTLDLP